MNTKTQLAYALAQHAHAGQKYGKHDYFEYHVLGVAAKFSNDHWWTSGGLKPSSCQKCGVNYLAAHFSEKLDCPDYDEDKYIVALLHDVVEDSYVDRSVINKLFGLAISFAVIDITHYKDQSYEEYIDCVKHNKIAKAVKIADLKFNLANNPKESLRKRYEKALAVLEQPDD